MNPEEPETEPTAPLPPFEPGPYGQPQYVQPQYAPPQQYGYQQPPQFAPYPYQPITPLGMSPRARKLWIRSIIGFVVVLVLAGSAWGAVLVLNSKKFGPEDAAKTYLSALQDGDVAKALELAPVSSRDGSKALLTAPIYKAASSRISGYSLGEVSINGDRASVAITLRGVAGDTTVSLRLKRDGNKYGVFHQWKVTDGGLAQSVEVNLPGENITLAVNGVSSNVTASGEYVLFPGTYAFNPYAGNKWISANDGQLVVDAGGDTDSLEVGEVSASQAFRTEVERQLAGYLAPCMRAVTFDPAGCPNEAYGYGDDTRKVKWTLTSSPVIDFSEFDGTFPAELSVSAGEASLTYEYDASYGYGPKDWQPESDTSSLYLDLEVRLVDNKLVADFSTY